MQNWMDYLFVLFSKRKNLCLLIQPTFFSLSKASPFPFSFFLPKKEGNQQKWQFAQFFVFLFLIVEHPFLSNLTLQIKKKKKSRRSGICSLIQFFFFYLAFILGGWGDKRKKKKAFQNFIGLDWKERKEKGKRKKEKGKRKKEKKEKKEKKGKEGKEERKVMGKTNSIRLHFNVVIAIVQVLIPLVILPTWFFHSPSWNVSLLLCNGYPWLRSPSLASNSFIHPFKQDLRIKWDVEVSETSRPTGSVFLLFPFPFQLNSNEVDWQRLNPCLKALAEKNDRVWEWKLFFESLVAINGHRRKGSLRLSFASSWWSKWFWWIWGVKVQGELGRRLKQGEWNCCKQKKKKRLPWWPERPPSVGAPCAFGLVSLNPVGKVQRKRGKVREKRGKVQEKCQKLRKRGNS